ncbi:MAG: hypothetical protein ACHP7N_02065 [Caulobacterales bacterium]
MSGEYRFVVSDAQGGPPRELTLVCASDGDALTVGARLARGERVEVWEDARRVGLAAEGDPAAASEALAPVAAPEAAQAQAPAQPTAPAPAMAAVPEPDWPEPDPNRPFNPFRPGDWRRLRRPS